MKQTYPFFLLLIFTMLIGLNHILAGTTENGKKTTSQPADTTKVIKVQAPPPQMLNFPVFSDVCKIRLNSYAQVRYQYYPPDNFDPNNPSTTTPPSSFDLRNARIILNGNPLRNISYRIQVDFAPPTVRALDAYAAYTVNTYIKFTVGQQKVPLSWESLRTDYNIQSISRSQVVEALTGRSKDVLGTTYTISSGVITGTTNTNFNGRDLGVLASGAIPNKNLGTNWIEYSLGVFQGQGINLTDKNKSKDIAGRLVVYPIKQLSIGGSFYSGSDVYGIDQKHSKDRNRDGFDISYAGDRILATFEYLHGLDSAKTENAKSAYGSKSGYYGMVEGFIVPKKLSALGKYDWYNPNTSVTDNTKETTIYSIALNYYFAPYTKFQLQYDFKHENNGAQIKNDLLSAQMQVYF